MTKQICNDEYFDEALQKMIPFEDQTQAASEIKPRPTVAPRAKVQPVSRTEETADDFVQVQGEFKTPDFLRKLEACGKWALAFGGMNLVLFWWLQAGYLAPEAAWPGMVAGALLGGLTVGYHAR